MTLKKRLQALEAMTAAKPEPEPLEVTVKREIFTVGPDGPEKVGEKVTMYRDGQRIPDPEEGPI